MCLGVILQLLNSPSSIQICDHFALVGLSLTNPNNVGDRHFVGLKFVRPGI